MLMRFSPQAPLSLCEAKEVPCGGHLDAPHHRCPPLPTPPSAHSPSSAVCTSHSNESEINLWLQAVFRWAPSLRRTDFFRPTASNNISLEMADCVSERGLKCRGPDRCPSSCHLPRQLLCCSGFKRVFGR